MDAARMRAGIAMHREEGVDFGADVVKVAGLEAGGGSEGVAVHRVARPDYGMLGVAHGFHQWRQGFGYLSCAHARDEREAARNAIGVEYLADAQGVFWRGGRPQLARQGVVHASQEFKVRSVVLAGALAHPEHVRRAVVPVARE